MAVLLKKQNVISELGNQFKKKMNLRCIKMKQKQNTFVELNMNE